MKSFHSHELRPSTPWYGDWEIQNPPDDVQCFAFDPTGSFLAVALANGMIEVWDVRGIPVAVTCLRADSCLFSPLDDTRSGSPVFSTAKDTAPVSVHAPSQIGVVSAQLPASFMKKGTTAPPATANLGKTAAAGSSHTPPLSIPGSKPPSSGGAMKSDCEFQTLVWAADGASVLAVVTSTSNLYITKYSTNPGAAGKTEAKFDPRFQPLVTMSYLCRWNLDVHGAGAASSSSGGSGNQFDGASIACSSLLRVPFNILHAVAVPHPNHPAQEVSATKARSTSANAATTASPFTLLCTVSTFPNLKSFGLNLSPSSHLVYASHMVYIDIDNASLWELGSASGAEIPSSSSSSSSGSSSQEPPNNILGGVDIGGIGGLGEGQWNGPYSLDSKKIPTLTQVDIDALYGEYQEYRTTAAAAAANKNLVAAAATAAEDVWRPLEKIPGYSYSIRLVANTSFTASPVKGPKAGPAVVRTHVQQVPTFFFRNDDPQYPSVSSVCIPNKFEAAPCRHTCTLSCCRSNHANATGAAGASAGAGRAVYDLWAERISKRPPSAGGTSNSATSTTSAAAATSTSTAASLVTTTDSSLGDAYTSPTARSRLGAISILAAEFTNNPNGNDSRGSGGGGGGSSQTGLVGWLHVVIRDVVTLSERLIEAEISFPLAANGNATPSSSKAAPQILPQPQPRPPVLTFQRSYTTGLNVKSDRTYRHDVYAPSWGSLRSIFYKPLSSNATAASAPALPPWQLAAVPTLPRASDHAQQMLLVFDEGVKILDTQSFTAAREFNLRHHADSPYLITAFFAQTFADTRKRHLFNPSHQSQHQRSANQAAPVVAEGGNSLLLHSNGTEANMDAGLGASTGIASGPASASSHAKSSHNLPTEWVVLITGAGEVTRVGSCGHQMTFVDPEKMPLVTSSGEGAKSVSHIEYVRSILPTQSVNLPSRAKRLQVNVAPSKNRLFVAIREKTRTNHASVMNTGVANHLTSHLRLALFRQAVISDFPGAMYPIGFNLINRCEPYIEPEDELDKVVLNRKDPAVSSGGPSKSWHVELPAGPLDIGSSFTFCNQSDEDKSNKYHLPLNHEQFELYLASSTNMSSSSGGGVSTTVKGAGNKSRLNDASVKLPLLMSKPNPLDAAILAYCHDSHRHKRGKTIATIDDVSMSKSHVPLGLIGSEFDPYRSAAVRRTLRRAEMPAAEGAEAEAEVGEKRTLGSDSGSSDLSPKKKPSTQLQAAADMPFQDQERERDQDQDEEEEEEGQAQEQLLPFVSFLRPPPRVASGEYRNTLGKKMTYAVSLQSLHQDKYIVRDRLQVYSDDACNGLIGAYERHRKSEYFRIDKEKKARIESKAQALADALALDMLRKQAQESYGGEGVGSFNQGSRNSSSFGKGNNNDDYFGGMASSGHGERSDLAPPAGNFVAPSPSAATAVEEVVGLQFQKPTLDLTAMLCKTNSSHPSPGPSLSPSPSPNLNQPTPDANANAGMEVAGELSEAATDN